MWYRYDEDFMKLPINMLLNRTYGKSNNYFLFYNIIPLKFAIFCEILSSVLSVDSILKNNNKVKDQPPDENWLSPL